MQHIRLSPHHSLMSTPGLVHSVSTVRTALSCLLVLGMMTLMPSLLQASEVPTLRIATWSYYIDTDSNDENLPMTQRSPTLRDFSKNYNCRIEYVEYDSEMDIERKLPHSNPSFDLLCGSSEFIASQGLDTLTPLNETDLPALRDVDSSYTLTNDKGQHLWWPYMAGTLGIVYRTDLVAKPVTSWRDYFHPDPQTKKPIHILDEPETLWSMSLLMHGLPTDSASTEQLRTAAGSVAHLIRSDLAGPVHADMAEIGDALQKGTISMGIMYSGDAYGLMQQAGAKNIAYSIPKEGSEYYVDGYALLRGSTQPELALAFLQYIAQPEVSGRIAAELGFQCPNPVTRPWLKTNRPDYFTNTVINPDPDTLKRLHKVTLDDPNIARIWLRLRD